MDSGSPFSILNTLPDTHLPHENFGAHAALEGRLRTTVRGEVRFDPASCALYATDASNYRQLPIGVVLPLDAEDAIAAVAACREFGAAVLSRGGGTSIPGQCCNVAVVLDFSKYMHRILSMDYEGKRARVEPGVVLDALRAEAERGQLTFAPDPATHNRCTIGGMIGNNSCGVHALMGGKTVDNIESLDVLLYDGTRMTVGPMNDEVLEDAIAVGGRTGAIYAGLKRIRERYASLVRQRFPDIPRRVSGYNLDQLLPENGFHVARALVGSEATCVTVLEATVRLMKSPQHRQLVVLGFADAFVAADAVPEILNYKPIGLEGFDSLLVDFLRRKQMALEDIALLPNGRGFLLVEFGADTNEEAREQAERFVQEAQQWATPPQAKRVEGEQAERIWRVRESALGAVTFVPGVPELWEGWEDSAVPPAKLGAYLRKLHALVQQFGYVMPIYGHFGQGCIHTRMSYDMRSVEGVKAYREFIERAADIVLEFGGSLSGEHGDGQSRGALLPKMFGPELMQGFREFKALWDPDNRMNPGKMMGTPDDPRIYQPEEKLRVGPGYEPARPHTHFAFPDDDGSFSNAAMRCVGVGACRKSSSGTMCPSYMATREEQHSTRGRAHLLWELMQSDALPGKWQNEQVHEALDLCLSCKACKSECPVRVDMATYKAEFFAQHYANKPRPLPHYLFGFMDRWARFASLAPGIANAALDLSGMESLAKRIADVAPERSLPRFASRSFLREQDSPANNNSEQENVLLWPDTWNNYLQPQVLDAAARVLRSAGYRVVFPRRHICCGRPLYDFGFLDRARRYLDDVLSRLAPQIDAGMPFIVLEPSCASVFLEELRNFYPKSERAQRLAKQTYLLADFLAEYAPDWRPPSYVARKIVLHGHCHHKAIFNMKAERSLLEQTGAQVTMLDSGCCGMAGPFGFERDKYSVSQTLGERVLLPAVRAADRDTIIVTDGFSCREQIAQGTSRRAVHVAELLAP
ncbi:MAG TPA: FAD-binding and (Fe-S)-binding domain-containing protein [Acidobacteriaceae bacterium]|jgi:FAD/FMN-containing dehydrogenase/Fe-S oxidoreductase